MTNKEINKARRMSHLFDQTEKDEMFQRVISAYGEALFKISEIQRELDALKAIYEFRKEGNKP